MNHIELVILSMEAAKASLENGTELPITIAEMSGWLTLLKLSQNN